MRHFFTSNGRVDRLGTVFQQYNFNSTISSVQQFQILVRHIQMSGVFKIMNLLVLLKIFNTYAD